MSKRAKRVLIAVAALTGATFIINLAVLPRMRMARLRAACAGGNRVVIDTNPWPEQFRKPGRFPDMPVFELTGEDKVAGLLEAIDLRGSVPFLECRCFGDLLISVYKRDTLLARLSAKHAGSLRWRDGRWAGEQPLTARGRARLDAYLTSHGCPTVADAAAEFGRRQMELVAQQAAEELATAP